MSNNPNHIRNVYNQSSLQDLNDDINDIFNNYVNSNANDSNDTLDSVDNRPPPISSSNHIDPNGLPIHITSRLSSLQVSNDDIHSAPQSPNSGSFNFRPDKYGAMSNTSLNILDTPTIEHNLREIIGEDSVNKSSDAIKSLHLDEGSENWNDKGAATKVIDNSNGFKVIRRTVQDFEFGKQLGEGSYSTVVLATDKITNIKYAVKILDKRHIIKEKKVKYVNIEKHALNRLSNRVGVVSLYFTFQDKDSLYFVLDYASNGELLSLIKKYNTLSEECTRHFGAQILDAIKYMHDNGVIHRDIKPENILLDDKLRIQITDFGTARLLEKKNDESEDYPLDVRAKSFVGTAEYVSPELLENKYCGKPGDIWAFGCILYQMIAGKPPFKAANEYLTFQKITKLQFAFSAGFPLILRDLIKQILVLQPSRRANISTIEDHYFFQGIDFEDTDKLWNAEPPEIGPFKMSAKSMMKMPEMAKSPSTQSVNVKRQPKKEVVQKRIVSEPISSSKPSNNNPKLNAAMVAAYVLNKNDDSPDGEDDTSSDIPNTPTDESNSNSSKAASRSNNHNPPTSRTPTTPQPEYIPGTNILRPTINSIHSYSRASSTRRKQSTKSKPKSKTMEVTPLTPLEVAWERYLKHADERIIKIGAVIAARVPTDVFERRHRGLIHESPLGFHNQHRNNPSFLTSVVNGNNSGLRSGNITEELEIEGDESKAIKDYFLIEEVPANSPTDNLPASRLSKFFLKLGISNRERSQSSEPVTQHPLEKSKTCTLIITSHGRVLIFFRNDPEANYRLISEIRICYPFMLFKEVITNSSKLLKLIPTTGMFAIESSNTTFTFEVEKHDVNGWTEALAKAQTNQFERIKLDRESKTKSPVLSPKLMASPEFAATNSKGLSRSQSTSKDNNKILTTTKSPPQSREREGLLNNRILARSSVKRKPPPPIKSTTGGLDMSTGLGNSSESGMLHAAQLAVSNTQHQKPTNNRRSSFTKDDKSSSASKIIRSSSTPSGKITTMNSKFLARSQRKK